ncbi:cytochrome P450 [Nonomuraea longispora]|nr:cytochrome P450 [Nonomuraea longispora]
MTEIAFTYPSDRRPGPFDPPDVFSRIRDQHPLTPMTFADGHEGWLASSHRIVRKILADDRFSNRRELMHLPIDRNISQKRQPSEPGMFIRMDPPEHTRYRRLLIAQFTVHRIKQLEPKITAVIQDCLDAMERSGPPVDLIEEFAVPIPSAVICDLLGIPESDRGDFQQAMGVAVDLNTKQDDLIEAFITMQSLFPPLIDSKRVRPTDDFYSDLINNSNLTDEELTNIGFMLFGAGFETTANMLGLGAFALLEHPGQVEALRHDRSLIDSTVEELLRYLTIIHIGPMRAALEDVDIEGVTVKKGQVVCMSLAAANRDPACFDDSDRLDITRFARAGKRNMGHLAFGHGIHQCLGQQLARSEMRLAFPALFDRFPDLRLALPPDEVPTRDAMVIYGVQRLPVMW